MDNAAHIGGLVSGLVIGFIFYPLLKIEDKGIKTNLALLGVLAVSVLSGWIYLNSPKNKIGPEKRAAELNYLNEAKFPDGEMFYEKYKEYVQSDEKIVNMFNDGTASFKDWLAKNEENINQEFAKATVTVTVMNNYNVSRSAKEQINLLGQLLDARKEQVSIVKQLAQEDNPASQLKLAEIRNRQTEVLAELNKKGN